MHAKGESERLFLSLPFEHSESLADQARAVELTRALGEESWARFARQHHEIIARRPRGRWTRLAA